MLAVVSTVGRVPASQPRQARPTIVAANTILADMVREVAGTTVNIHCLVPAGVDIHGFEPKPADVAHLSGCDLVVFNGAGFEPWLQKLLQASGYKGPRLEATRGVALLQRGAGDHVRAQDRGIGDADRAGETELDPHAWQSAANGIRYVLNIRDVLVQLVPDARTQIELRTQLYVAQLEALHSWMRRVLTVIPAGDRRIVTSHDSFAYLGQACGLEILPTRGLDSSQEPDARQVAALVDELREKKVRAIFVEAVSNPKMLEQLARDTGAAIGGELFSDSLGPRDTCADSYLGMLRENTLTIVDALKGR